MKKFIISKAESDDIPDIKRVEIERKLSAWTIDDYHAELVRRDTILLKAHDESGALAGFVVGRAPAGGEAEILNMGTALSFQRKGIGSMLIREFIAICVERRVSSIWLEVRASNTSAIAFYKAHGFKTEGVRNNYYSNPTENAELMAFDFGGLSAGN